MTHTFCHTYWLLAIGYWLNGSLGPIVRSPVFYFFVRRICPRTLCIVLFVCHAGVAPAFAACVVCRPGNLAAGWFTAASLDGRVRGTAWPLVGLLVGPPSGMQRQRRGHASCNNWFSFRSGRATRGRPAFFVGGRFHHRDTLLRSTSYAGQEEDSVNRALEKSFLPARLFAPLNVVNYKTLFRTQRSTTQTG